MPNQFTPVNPGTPIESAIAAINKNFAQLDNQAITKVFYGPNRVPSFIEGRLPNDGYGIQLTDPSNVARAVFFIDADGNPIFRISESGVDVNSATDDQLIFNSDQNVLKVVQTATTSITLTNVANVVAGGVQTTTIPHNLGFQPVSLVYITTPPGSVDGGVLTQLPHTTFVSNDPSAGPFFYFSSSVDSTNLYVKFNHGYSTDYSPDVPTFSIRYYLLQENAN